MSNITAQKNPSAFGIAMGHQGISFLELLSPYKLKMALGALVLVMTNLLAVSLPSLVNLGVGLLKDDGKKYVNIWFFKWSFNGLLSLVFLVVIVAIIGAIIRTISRILIFDVGRLVERDLRERVIVHVSALDDEFFSRHQVGDIMSHLTNDISNVRMMAGFALLSILNIIIIFVFSVPLLMKIDSVLALVALLPFPLVMIATRRLTKRMFEATKNYQEHLSHVVNHVQENLGGAHVVRLFHQQEAEGVRFSTTNRRIYESSIKLAHLRVLLLPTMRLMIGIALALVLLVGGHMVLSGHIEVGDLVEINARIMQLTWPAMSIGFVISIMSRGQASLSRLNILLNANPKIIDGLDELERVDTIHVHNLSVGPKAHISFSLKTGEMLGLVGPSGSYKTILLRMLYRRINVEQAKIFYNEHDVVNLSLNSLNRHVSVVTQEPFLFHKSIKENIVFFNPHASMEEINHVIATVKLDKDIKNFTEGIETIIGERGITLSGGQRQRVALARALLAKRSVLILDDALSAVDAETEGHILSSMKTLLKDSIIVVATHRLSAIKEAQHILVLDKGSVVARGTHEQLLKSSSLYCELWGQS